MNDGRARAQASQPSLVDETGHLAWYSRTPLWGTTTHNRDATAYTPLRFPGQYADPETALHYNFFRHYDPDTARYTSPDPLGLIPSPNPLAYPQNPFSWTDPHGLASECGTNKETPEEKAYKKELMDLAKQHADHVMAGLSGDDHAPAAYSVGRDVTTGEVYYGESRTDVGLAPEVAAAMPSESQVENGRPPGVCAEPRMFTRAIADGADPANLDVVTVNQSGKKYKMCPNCSTWVPGFGGRVLTG